MAQMSNLPSSYYGNKATGGGGGGMRADSGSRSSGSVGGKGEQYHLDAGVAGRGKPAGVKSKNKSQPDLTDGRHANPIAPEGRRQSKTQPMFKGTGKGAPPDRQPKTEEGRAKNKMQPSLKGVGKGKGMAKGGTVGKKNIGGGNGGSAPLTRGKSGGGRGSGKMMAAGSPYTDMKAAKGQDFRQSTYHL